MTEWTNLCATVGSVMRGNERAGRWRAYLGVVIGKGAYGVVLRMPGAAEDGSDLLLRLSWDQVEYVGPSRSNVRPVTDDDAPLIVDGTNPQALADMEN